MEKEKMIKLGDRVKDPISGVIGIAIAKTIWLHGCNRITVQPQGLDKDKKPFETTTVDEPQLIVVKKKVKKRSHNDTGGVLYTVSPKKPSY